MDNPNITMEEYIRLEEEKAHRHGKVYNWKLLRMVRSGIMKTFTTSDLLKLNSQVSIALTCLRNVIVKERIPSGPSPQPQALGTTFKARVRDYMATHTKRMERFENTIVKHREEINGKMTEMFGLLKELTTRRTPEKVLIREEAKFPVTKNVKSISLIKGEEGGSDRMKVTPDNAEKLTETEMEMPVMEVEKINKVENGDGNKSIKTSESEEAQEAPGSQPVAYYLKHNINEKLIKGENKNRPFILGTPFLTIAKASIKFDTCTITLRLYLMRRSLEVLRKFHWMILEDDLTSLSHYVDVTPSDTCSVQAPSGGVTDWYQSQGYREPGRIS
ncbi:hypothetical protein Tco_0825646, partial [Tanacetum coccineum]